MSSTDLFSTPITPVNWRDQIKELEQIFQERRATIEARMERLTNPGERDTITRAINELTVLAQEHWKAQVPKSTGKPDPLEKSKRFQELIYYGASRMRAVILACDDHIETHGEDNKDWFWRGLAGELVSF